MSTLDSMPRPRGPRPGNPAPGRRFGRFTGTDLLAVVLYVALPLAVVLLPLDRAGWIRTNPAVASYLLNLGVYGVVFVVAAISARAYFARDVRILATRPWFTAGILPLMLIAMLVVTAILVTLAGGIRISQNQQDIESVAQGVPWWFTAPLLVVVGPFVEEFVFRHLMIGKLSLFLNRWLCYAISIALFASLHIVGRDDFTIQALAPYLGLGAVLVFAYAWTGNNLAFSVSLHALKNLLSVVLMYTLDLSALQP
ncbi:CPBP family intramembrane glutamic endopeptidase [Sinomonas sp. JGH33]|uniref:CPBP family intramembrane glutamic endopeptidase n=1 Tax=Sinomonas terricola TaxID=3110330 RepID=A0ABU5T2L4_9MICC|nr:CPBP family intramembrane glutamic endopeptidase [Sinomonas sp. JGH33]MEA5453716.1 CPBP family intramembrane glutamic endopeptidase [Sinomonas sp. JGH33]